MTKEPNQNFTSDKEGSFDPNIESHGKKPHTALYDVNWHSKSVDETHSTPETEFEKLKRIIMSQYCAFTTGQANSYIHKKLKYRIGDNFSKQFWMQMYSALEGYGYPFDNSPKVD